MDEGMEDKPARRILAMGESWHYLYCRWLKQADKNEEIRGPIPAVTATA
jgi:hypothetical protein